MISLVSDTVAQMRALGADVIDNVPFSSAAESRRQPLDIYWDIIRELALSKRKVRTTY